MDKALLVYLLIEAVLFLMPIVKVFMVLGSYKEKVEKLERRVEALDSIDNRLSTIESKLDLLIDGKIKITDN